MSYSLLSQAILLAVERHDGGYRDGEFPLPYSTHPIEVLSFLRNVGGVTDEELLCVAALHDLLEDTDTKPEEIEVRFGTRVSDLVKELTRTEPTADVTQGMAKDDIWQLRADMLIADIAAMSTDAQQVKLADRLSNIRETLRTRKGEKLRRYVRQTKKILEIIPKSVNPSLWKAIANELA